MDAKKSVGQTKIVPVDDLLASIASILPFAL